MTTYVASRNSSHGLQPTSWHTVRYAAASGASGWPAGAAIVRPSAAPKEQHRRRRSLREAVCGLQASGAADWYSILGSLMSFLGWRLSGLPAGGCQVKSSLWQIVQAKPNQYAVQPTNKTALRTTH